MDTRRSPYRHPPRPLAGDPSLFLRAHSGAPLQLLLSLFLLSSRLQADTSGAAFLKIGDGARPLALAGAYTAAQGSVDSLYYNPAGLASLGGKELSLTHSDWLQGMGFDVVSYGQSTDLGTLGISALRLGGTQEGRDANRRLTGDFSTEDIAGVLSYSHTIAMGASTPLSAGANIKYLRSRIASDSASTYAFDFGAVGRTPVERLRFGAAVLNIGPGLRFVEQRDHLPLTVAFGAAYAPTTPLEVSLDFKHEPFDSMSELDAGAQYSLGPFAFRAGYAAPVQGLGTSLSAMDHFRGGLGIKISHYRADYTLAPFGDLGLTQRFTLSAAFGAADSDLHPPQNLQPHALGKIDPQQIAALFGPL